MLWCQLRDRIRVISPGPPVKSEYTCGDQKQTTEDQQVRFGTEDNPTSSSVQYGEPRVDIHSGTERVHTDRPERIEENDASGGLREERSSPPATRGQSTDDAHQAQPREQLFLVVETPTPASLDSPSSTKSHVQQFGVNSDHDSQCSDDGNAGREESATIHTFLFGLIIINLRSEFAALTMRCVCSNAESTSRNTV